MNIRSFIKYENILYVVVVLAIAYIVSSAKTVPEALENGRLAGNAAVLFLYISLIASALNAHFRAYPLRMWLIRSRKAHGIVALLFAEAHGFLMVFRYLGGPQELMTSDYFYQISVLMGIIASYVLIALGATSYSLAMRKMGIWWKRLHRLVYLSGVLIIAHVVLVRVYYQKLSDPLSILSLVMFGLLLALEISRLAKYLARRRALPPKPNVEKV